MIYKFRETTKDNLFICDGKENYTTLVSIFPDLPNVGRTKEEIFDYIKDAENLMDEDFKVQIQQI